eukprot:9499719-Pyramimonas_sp.AAC.2
MATDDDDDDGDDDDGDDDDDEDGDGDADMYVCMYAPRNEFGPDQSWETEGDGKLHETKSVQHNAMEQLYSRSGAIARSFGHAHSRAGGGEDNERGRIPTSRDGACARGLVARDRELVPAHEGTSRP